MTGIVSLAVSSGLRCIVKNLIEESCRGFMYARVVRCIKRKSMTESWIRLCGDPVCIENFILNCKMKRGVRVTSVYGGRSNRFVRILFTGSKCNLDSCPHNIPVRGVLIDSVIVSRSFVLVKAIAVRRGCLKKLEDYGFKIVLSRKASNTDYMLTPRQEEVLVKAFMLGYYDYPRKMRLDELARALGISVSTLAEHMRRAEKKLIEAFMKHEAPHYLLNMSSSDEL